MTSPSVIAIDGPVGTGKGTIAQRLATGLGWHVLDSGAIYRILALGALKADVPTDAVDRLVALAACIKVEFRVAEADEPVVVLLDGEDVTEAIRNETTGSAASKLAAHAPVRDALLELQRSFLKPPGLVADGRDMGSVVFPQAAVKIFLTASVEERAERRYKQLIAKGIGVSLASLLADITERDKRDRERTVAPLKPAEGAVVIDTTGKSIAEVMAEVMVLLSRSDIHLPVPEQDLPADSTE